jgi:ribonuclease P/MRP protein subunit POP5
MAGIKPSLKEKKRYLVFEIVSNAQISSYDARKAINDACLRYLGEFGCAKANVFYIQDAYVPEHNRGIIRVANKAVDDVRAAMVMITRINDTQVIVHTLGISGILKKAKNKFLFTKHKENTDTQSI